MFTLIIMLFTAAVAAVATYFAGEGGHWGWAIPAALGAALVVAIPINLWVRKRLNAIFTAVQQNLTENMETLNRKAQSLLSRGVNVDKVMDQLEKEQVAIVHNVLPMLDEVKPIAKWNSLATKQADMLRGQLLFQIRDFDGARPLLENVLLIADPMMLCMQMVLHYLKDKEETEKLDKLFKKGLGRFKYDQATMIYALYSWILVKQGRITEAVTVLNEGKEKTSNLTIAQNWEHLANNRVKRFSNAEFGDKWYALGLEKPKMTTQNPRMSHFGGRVRRGPMR